MIYAEIHWLLILMIVCFMLGAVFGSSLSRWPIKMLQYFLKPNYLKLVGQLKSENGKSKITHKK